MGETKAGLEESSDPTKTFTTPLEARAPWELVDLGSEFHFIPSQDKMSHDNTSDCHCSPTHQATIATEDQKIPFFAHNSFDLREIDDWWARHISNGNSEVFIEL